MKFPKVGVRDNELAELLYKIPLFNNLTISEIAILLQIVFSNLFNLILSISRLVDLNPLENQKLKFTKLQKKGFNS